MSKAEIDVIVQKIAQESQVESETQIVVVRETVRQVVEVEAGAPQSVAAEDVSYNNTTSGLTADEVQAAIDEIVGLIPSDAPVDTVFGRIGDVVALSGDYDAIQVDYDNTTTGITATDVQDALDELFVLIQAAGDVDTVFGRTGDVVAVAGDYTAAQVTYDNTTSGLSATEVQAAIDELASGSGGGVWGTITGTLSDQTDLQAALDAKLDLAGGTMTGDLITASGAQFIADLGSVSNPSYGLSGMPGFGFGYRSVGGQDKLAFAADSEWLFEMSTTALFCRKDLLLLGNDLVFGGSLTDGGLKYFEGSVSEMFYMFGVNNENSLGLVEYTHRDRDMLIGPQTNPLHFVAGNINPTGSSGRGRFAYTQFDVANDWAIIGTGSSTLTPDGWIDLETPEFPLLLKASEIRTMPTDISDGYTVVAAGSEVTTDDSFTTITKRTIEDGGVYMVEVSFVGVRDDNTERIGAKLLAVVYNNGSGAVIQNDLITAAQYNPSILGLIDATLKVNGDDILAQGRGENGETYNWSASIAYNNVTI